jgi:hypothetical protein
MYENYIFLVHDENENIIDLLINTIYRDVAVPKTKKTDNVMKEHEMNGEG